MANQAQLPREGSDGPTAESGMWHRLTVTALETDLAYFAARLKYIGEPTTINQKAQVDAFRFLSRSMESILNRLRSKSSE